MSDGGILDAHVLVQQAVVAYCPVLDAKHGDRLAARLAHGMQAVLLENVGAFVRRTAHVPLLLHYQSDATSYLTSTASTTRSFDGNVQRRSGHHISEYLLERAFVCARPLGAATHESAVLVLMPRSLEHGKGALQCFSANTDSVALPRQHGHLNDGGAVGVDSGVLLEWRALAMVGRTCGRVGSFVAQPHAQRVFTDAHANER